MVDAALQRCRSRHYYAYRYRSRRQPPEISYGQRTQWSRRTGTAFVRPFEPTGKHEPVSEPDGTLVETTASD